MDPVTSQPSFGFEDQGIFGGQKPVLSGLEKLSKVNELKVHHGRLTCVEVCSDYDRAHMYQVFDENFQQIYTLAEKSECCDRCCCKNLRALTISLNENNGEEVLRMERPFRCVDCPSNSCYPDKTQLIEIFHQGELIGRVRERPICIGQDRHLEVFNDMDEKLYDINGPCCYNPCAPVSFDIKNDAGVPYGQIIKEFTGCEGAHGNDKFRIEFPTNINEKTKAILLGATMLADYMYFEKERQSMHGLFIGLPICLISVGLNLGLQGYFRGWW